MSEEIEKSDGSAAASDRDARFRDYIADTILGYATNRGADENHVGYRRVMGVTGRTLGTVKNWLAYRVNLPDLASMGRIVEHWKIPPATIFPVQLDALLAGNAGMRTALEVPVAPGLDHLVLSLYGNGDLVKVDKALSTYTEHPRRTLLLRQDVGDMRDEIRAGELMLLDPTCEQLAGNGLYLLKFDKGGAIGATCVRAVEIRLSESVVRIRGVSSTAANFETVSLLDGAPVGVSVLGRVVGVLKQV